jgi:hypothetical protein
MEADPFANPMLNEIFKPIMALDKLMTLRRERVCYEILLLPKNLKTLSKDRRAELLANLSQPAVQEVASDDEEAEKEEGCDSKPVEGAEAAVEVVKKKKKKNRKGMLTASGARYKSGAELAWVENTKANQALSELKKAQQMEAKKGRTSSKQAESAADEKDDHEQSDSTKNSEQPYEFVPANKQTSLDDLYEKFSVGQYHSLQSLTDDLNLIVQNAKLLRCKNDLACKYLDQFFIAAQVHINKKNTEFLQKWRLYHEAKFAENQTQFSRVSSWYKSAGPRRHYNIIDDYKVVTSLSPDERKALAMNPEDRTAEF